MQSVPNKFIYMYITYLKHLFYNSVGQNYRSLLCKLNDQSRDHKHLKINMSLIIKTNIIKHL